MTDLTEVEFNRPNYPQPIMTEEQEEEFNAFLIKNINKVFEHDFEGWSDNYWEAVHGNS